MKKYKHLIFVFLLTFISLIFHFYHLTWGAPFYFHPDERNIASSVSQLHFPTQMNPHFFAYGSLPIYTIYFTGYVLHLLQTPTVSFEQAILISRFYSATFATLLIPLLFFIGKKLKDQTAGLFAAFFGTMSVGFIQFAHFGTFEMWLTFFSVLLFFIYLLLPKLPYKLSLLLFGSIAGILVAVKVSHLALVPVVLLILFLEELQRNKKHRMIYKLGSMIRTFLVFFFCAFLIYFVTNPFVFSDTTAFRDSMRYESTLAIGTLPVFYTGEFFNTVPVLFQFLSVYPFLINPLLTMLLIPSFIYIIWKIIKTKNITYGVLVLFFLILLFSQAFFYVKWTRYMMPTLPFLYLIIAFALCDLFYKFKKSSTTMLVVKTIFITLLIFIQTVFAFSYFITAFVKEDTRNAAYHFARDTLSPNVQILSEVYDMGIVPFNEYFDNIFLFHFYDLDNNSPIATTQTLQQALTQKDYIILPSQRILKTRLLKKEQFPQGNAFYEALTTGRLGYTKIYETPCDIFCKITYLGDPIFRFEQTANVFDRPTVMIFKKK